MEGYDFLHLIVIGALMLFGYGSYEYHQWRISRLKYELHLTERERDLEREELKFAKDWIILIMADLKRKGIAPVMSDGRYGEHDNS